MKYLLAALVAAGLVLVGVEVSAAAVNSGQVLSNPTDVTLTAAKKKTKKAKKKSSSKVAKK